MHGATSVVLTTSGGLNLWLGNNAAADGVNPFAWGAVETTLEAVRQKAGSAAAADGAFRALAIDFWTHDPGAALGLLAKKLAWTWNQRELPNTIDIDWQLAQSGLFAWRPVFPLGLGTILPLAAAGAVIARHRWRELALVAGLVVIGVGSSVLFFTNARFRLPMAPALLMLAGVAAARVSRVVSERRWRFQAAAPALVAACAGALVAWNGAWGVRTYRVPELTINAGILEREAGELARAIDHLREGLAARPDDAIARVHLALALEQHGDVERALEAYAEGLARTPDDHDLREMADRFMERHGVGREARKE
jgi:tetratricopeptide (TPR) repeat protein